MAAPTEIPNTGAKHQFSDNDLLFLRNATTRGWSLGTLESQSRQVFHQALQTRLDAGDISQADIDTVKKASKWPGLVSFAGLGAGIPFWRSMSRPRPLAPAGLPFGLKLMTAGLAGLLGSTLGIMVGSLIGSWSIKHNLVDAERKLSVLKEIQYDATRAVQERMAGVPEGTIVVHRAGVPDQTRYLTVDEARAALEKQMPPK